MNNDEETTTDKIEFCPEQVAELREALKLDEEIKKIETDVKNLVELRERVANLEGRSVQSYRSRQFWLSIFMPIIALLVSFVMVYVALDVVQDGASEMAKNAVETQVGDLPAVITAIAGIDDNVKNAIEESMSGPRRVTLIASMFESGSVRSNGSVRSVINVGDTADDLGSQVFLAFDISMIPDDAEVRSVEVDFGGFDTLGQPFANLGCLRAYTDDYGSLSSSAYYREGPLEQIGSWCSTDDLAIPNPYNSFGFVIKESLREKWFKIRLQFNELETNNDGTDDMVRLGIVTLIVNYETQ